MADNETRVSLSTLCGGAAIEKFDDEFNRVVANILDPNTDVKTVREITLKVRIKPNEMREVGAVEVGVSSKQGSVKSSNTVVFFGRRNGQAVATERNPKQLSFDDADGDDEGRQGVRLH